VSRDQMQNRLHDEILESPRLLRRLCMGCYTVGEERLLDKAGRDKHQSECIANADNSLREG